MCTAYRGSLRRIYNRWSKQKENSPPPDPTTSRVNVRYLSTPDRKKRYSKLRSEYRAQSKEVIRLKERIAKAIEVNKIQLASQANSDFLHIMKDMTQTVHSQCPEGSFKRIFWDQQMQANTVRNTRQMRWHPAIIKWCLHLKFMSSSCYNALRTSGLITLPSERFLRDYTHWMKSEIGFSEAVDIQLTKEANISEEKDRYIILIWDEMKIKEDLVFNKHTLEIVGFVNIGEINDQIEKITQNNDNRDIASHILLLMVRGIFTNLEFPYAHFSTKGIHADSLFSLVWDAVYHLESCGFNVIAFCCDGASPNRKFYKMHQTDVGLVYKTVNPFSPDREIYFISDVSHLLTHSLVNMFGVYIVFSVKINKYSLLVCMSS